MKKRKIISSMLLLMLMLTAFVYTGCSTLDKGVERELSNRVKTYEKNGFEELGGLTLREYLRVAREKELARIEEGENRYMVVRSRDVGPTYQNAKEASLAGVRSQIASQLETRVAGLTKRSLNNNQISQSSADAINKIVTAEKHLYAQTISYSVIYTFHRDIKDERDGKKIVEVELLAYYDPELVDRILKENLKDKIRKDMESEAEKLHEDLYKIFDF